MRRRIGIIRHIGEHEDYSLAQDDGRTGGSDRGQAPRGGMESAYKVKWDERT